MRRTLTILLATVTLIAIVAEPTTAIVNGHDADAEHGAVSMWSPSPHRNRCTGTLITERWVVSAAHCAAVVGTPGQTTIRVGMDNVTNFVEVGLDAVYAAPDFDPVTFAHDVGLYRLASPVPASVARPLALGSTALAVNEDAVTAGWGWPCEVGPTPPCRTSVMGHLQELRVRAVPDATCDPLSDVDPAGQTCYASAQRKDAMSCFGDSGAPIATGELDDEVLRAVVTLDGDDHTGASCATAPNGGPPLGVAADVAPEVPWIVATIVGKGDTAPLTRP